MNWDIVKGNWKQFKGNVRQQWGKLTDDHLEQIAGTRTELAGKIQEAYGVTQDDAERQIKAFEGRYKDYRP
ncbi:CsbD family protein [Chitinimonas sp. BJYL2]|uniref:CsbD family protein n=1 Tax=Chitinimonas sp. BJYL2 TaxID=2976696 RepID=UPI0022B4218C|nr:CsbD family protein [Chitinimonas sp. BJYL2]